MGQPYGTVACVNIGQIILSIRCKDVHAPVIQEALHRARYKLPGRQKVINVEEVGIHRRRQGLSSVEGGKERGAVSIRAIPSITSDSPRPSKGWSIIHSTKGTPQTESTKQILSEHAQQYGPAICPPASTAGVHRSAMQLQQLAIITTPHLPCQIGSYAMNRHSA